MQFVFVGPYPLTKDIKLGFQPKLCIRKTELRPDVFNHILPVSTSCRFTIVEQTVYSYKNQCWNIIVIIYSNKWYKFMFWTYSVSTNMNSYHILFTQIQNFNIFLLILYTWPAVDHMQTFVFFFREHLCIRNNSHIHILLQPYPLPNAINLGFQLILCIQMRNHMTSYC